jgi:hypothetical protein
MGFNQETQGHSKNIVEWIFLLAVGMKQVGNTLTLRRPRKLANPERSRTFSSKLVPRGQDLGPPVSDSIRGP